jgi:serine protease Do
LQGGNEKLRFQAGAYEVGGDTILAVGGHKVVRPEDLARFVSSYKPGQKVALEVLHDNGDRENVEITLGKRPEAGPAG